MIRVGLAHTAPSYAGLAPPWNPGRPYPEILFRFGAMATAGVPNPSYEGVRAALHGLGLDNERFGSPDWNPLGALARQGARIALKPNFIRHWNPQVSGTLDSVITHGSVVRAIADYAFLAAGAEGSVVIAEAPQQDCDFDKIREVVGLDALRSHYAALGLALTVIDLRTEAVQFEDGIIVSRQPLPGDPAGYRVVDLGEQSFFAGSGLDPRRFRGADYDPTATTEHHIGGRNAYLLSETVLSADLIVNLPKLKTHKKTGVTLALKNLVGINGDKNWLPHHSVGAPANGGDEFPDGRFLDRLRSRAVERARPLLDRGIGLRAFRISRRLEAAVRGHDFVRSGNWYGNRTTWRMCCDLNRCLYFSDRKGLHLEAESPVRTVLSVIDGIVGGEGDGPLAPSDVGLGVVIASTDPIAADLVAVRLLGFDERRIPKIWESMQDRGPRCTAVSSDDDIAVGVVDRGLSAVRDCRLDAIHPLRRIAPHPGWVGHLELAP